MLLRSVSSRVLGAAGREMVGATALCVKSSAGSMTHALRLRAKSGVREDVGEAHGAHAKSAAARRQEQEENCARHRKGVHRVLTRKCSEQLGSFFWKKSAHWQWRVRFDINGTNTQVGTLSVLSHPSFLALCFFLSLHYMYMCKPGEARSDARESRRSPRPQPK